MPALITHSTMAHSAAESRYGSLWRNLEVAYVPMFGSSGLKTIDLAGNKKAWVKTAGASATVDSLQSGAAGKYAQFVASSSIRATAGVLSFPGNVSVAVWFSTTDYTSTQCLIGNGVSGAGNNNNVSLEFGRTDNRFTSLQNGGSVDYTSGRSISDARPHCFCLTRYGATGSWTLSGFLDGARDATATVSANPGAGPVALTIGRYGEFNGLYLNANVYAVYVWRRALDASEACRITYDPLAMFRPRTRSMGRAASGAGQIFRSSIFNSAIIRGAA